MYLPIISDEQSSVINLLKTTNLIVDSVAGSGKTTTNLFIAKHYKECNILLLTYNKKLKFETRDKVKHHNIRNLEVHSYHSFCVKNYDRKCFTDQAIKKILKNKKLNEFKYDIIILDEAQDITPLYYELICKIFKDNGESKLCILGDRMQSIYDFNKADSRYIILADKIFKFNDKPWKLLNLSESFRITDKMTDFINICMLKENKIKSNKKSNYKPRYIICDSFGDKFGLHNENVPYDEVNYYLKLGYSYEDIFILAPSVKSEKSPVRQLSNLLSNDNIPVYVPVSDEERIDESILKGKLVFSTFHQAKGLERKVIIVYNFDNSYFKFYKKNSNPNLCSNELYVACSRGLEHLTMIHHYENEFLSFLDKDKLKDCCNVIEHSDLRISRRKNKKINISVTDLVRHLPFDVIEECMKLLEVNNLKKEDTKINIPQKTKQEFGYESVSELTGLAIPAYFEYKLLNKMTIFNEKIRFEKKIEFVDEEDEELLDINNLDLNELTIPQLLYLANRWSSYKSGFFYKLNQISDYNWLSEENLEKAFNRLKNLNISKQAKFEKKINIKDEKELLERNLTGYFDCVDKNDLYEFKCVSKLEPEHYLQLAIYMYMNKLKYKKEYKYYLYNILTDELNEVKCDIDNLKKIISILIKYKYFNNNKISDKEFIDNNLKIFS